MASNPVEEAFVLLIFVILGGTFLVGLVGWAYGLNDASAPTPESENGTWKDFWVAMVTPTPPDTAGIERWKNMQLMQPAETRTRVVSMNEGPTAADLNCFGSGGEGQTKAKAAGNPRPEGVSEGVGSSFDGPAKPAAAAAAAKGGTAVPPPPRSLGASGAGSKKKASAAILGGANAGGAKSGPGSAAASDVQSDTSSNDPGTAKNALRKKAAPKSAGAPAPSAPTRLAESPGFSGKGAPAKKAPPPRKSTAGYAKEDVQLV